MRFTSSALCLLACLAVPASALSDGNARTPPMGFNTWYAFKCTPEMNETSVMAVAKALVDLGLRDAGYDHVNLDDCWMAGERDAEGRLTHDTTRFPSGMAALGEYLHGLGLKFGVYSSAGTKTCQGLPASLDKEDIDAKTWASWGVDLIKLDNCFNERRPAKKRYGAMSKAIQKAGRPMLYSICEWGLKLPARWAPEVGHMWRTTPDIFPTWFSVYYIMLWNSVWAKYAGPGQWNDPDMLQIGWANKQLSEQQTKCQFGAWAAMKAPLFFSQHLDKMTPEQIELLKNKEILAVNQDPLGIQAARTYHKRGVVVLSGPLARQSVPKLDGIADGEPDSDWVIYVLHNSKKASKKVKIPLKILGAPKDAALRFRELYTGTDMPTPLKSRGLLRFDALQPYDCFMYRVSAEVAQKANLSVADEDEAEEDESVEVEIEEEVEEPEEGDFEEDEEEDEEQMVML